MGPVRIVSLLPSATEIVFALGLGGALVGVTDECDHPPEARSKPAVSRAALSGGLSAAEVDREVRERMARGEPLYSLDTELIRELRPDLILAQDLCRVCAVPSGHVEAALETLGGTAAVLSLDPSTLDDVLSSIGEVGRAAGAVGRASAVERALRARIAEVRSRVGGLAPPRVLALEWSDPPFTGGHWVPGMIEAAGGESLLARAGEPSRETSWSEVGAAAPEVVVFMPCGYGLARAVDEGRALTALPALAPAARMYAVDATSYFSRPGPRLVDGVEALAWALHPSPFPEPPPGRIARLR